MDNGVSDFPQLARSVRVRPRLARSEGRASHVLAGRGTYAPGSGPGDSGSRPAREPGLIFTEACLVCAIARASTYRPVLERSGVPCIEQHDVAGQQLLVQEFAVLELHVAEEVVAEREHAAGEDVGGGPCSRAGEY